MKKDKEKSFILLKFCELTQPAPRGFWGLEIDMKKYNVLCITKRSADDRNVNFHLPAPANTAIVDRKTVEFDGNEYPLAYQRSGLDGKAVLLGLLEPNGAYLELYTDTPVEESGATPESLRKKAEWKLSRK